MTVEGRRADGELLTEDAEARVSVVRGGGWWPPRKAALVAGGVALVALLALAAFLLTRDGVDARVYDVGTFVPDVDARGQNVAFLATVGPERTEVRRLNLETGDWERLAPKAKHDGLDVGLNDATTAQVVYSRCEPPQPCDLWRSSFSGARVRLPASTDQCSETRPSMWAGLLLFVRGGGSDCGRGLRLGRANSSESVQLTGNTRGADLNGGDLVWLSMDRSLVAKKVDTRGKVTSQGTLASEGEYTFDTPIVVDGDYVYFVHSGPQIFIARAQLPLRKDSEIEHYSPGTDISEATERPHFAVTGDKLYTTKYPQPDGKFGEKKIVRVTKPDFEPAN